jgi:7-cyano-7-deazaguanine reductase
MDDLSSAPLGHNSDYPKHYAPELLFPVVREEARSSLPGYTHNCFVGYDEWNLYELAWLDEKGSPQMGIGRLQIVSTTPNIVESKSLKLYCNSLFYKNFSSEIELTKLVKTDLEKILGGEVAFQVLELNKPLPDSGNDYQYSNLDPYSVEPQASPDASRITAVDSPEEVNRYEFHRFRSLCPVTGQPDWASVFIRMDGVGAKGASLAQYLLSYAEHQGFHENCLEAIFCDLKKHLEPEALSVAARFTRRGGIDINPVRATSAEVLEMPSRQIRQ